MKIAPSLLGADFSKLGEELKSIEDFTDILHLDVMDNHFVPNISFGPAVIKALRDKTKMIFDTHLMIENPGKYVDEYIKAGSDYITIHYEAEKDIIGTLRKIKASGAKAGVSFKPKTDISADMDFLAECDLILIMTVEPGFGGQEFIEAMVSKIKKAIEIKAKKNLSYLISADGGINDKTIGHVSGLLDIAVSGSYIFRHPDKKKAFVSLKK